MAMPEDYVDREFGRFVITDLVNRGFEREIYRIFDVSRYGWYTLKLHSENDVLWDAEPLIPPPNGAYERGEVVGGDHLLEQLEPLLSDEPEAKARLEMTRASLELGRPDYPELAENVFVRLCAAAQRGDISHEAFVHTLRSREFDLNMSPAEAVQLAVVQNAFHRPSPTMVSGDVEDARRWVDACVEQKSLGSLDPNQDSALFELSEVDPPEVADMATVLYRP